MLFLKYMKKLTLKEYFNYLPKLNTEELYLFYLISRDREAKQMGLSIDKILFRIKEEDPEKATRILEAIRQNVEFQVKGIKLKKEWIKIMHVLNPVNFAKASHKAAIRYVEQCKENLNIEKLYNSELPRNVDFRIFMIDIDTKDKKILEKLIDIRPRLVITTKRGYHFHVWKEDLENPQTLFKIADKEIEIKTRNSIEYVPFILQGNFTPEAYEINNVEEVKDL